MTALYVMLFAGAVTATTIANNEHGPLEIPEGLLDPPPEETYCEIEQNPAKPMSKPPSDRERCINGVEMAYGQCLASGQSQAWCFAKRAFAMAGCFSRSDE